MKSTTRISFETFRTCHGTNVSATVANNDTPVVTLPVMSIAKRGSDNTEGGTVYVTVLAGTGYTVAVASVGVADNAYPPGFPTLSVSNATASEISKGFPCMTFTVTLSRVLEAGERVDVVYRTRESTPVSARGTFGPRGLLRHHGQALNLDPGSGNSDGSAMHGAPEKVPVLSWRGFGRPVGAYVVGEDP